MNIVFNEPVCEIAKEKNDQNLYKIIYEPFENHPNGSFDGSIFSKGKSIQTFEITIDNEVKLSNFASYENNAISGYFCRSRKSMILYWKQDPGEHTLLVSYLFEYKKPLKKPKRDWIQEGF